METSPKSIKIDPEYQKGTHITTGKNTFKSVSKVSTYSLNDDDYGDKPGSIYEEPETIKFQNE